MPKLILDLKFLRILLAVFLLQACKDSESQKTGQPQLSPAKTCLNTEPAPIVIDNATALIGSDLGYPEERPPRQVILDAFEIDTVEVTNAQFEKFVDETGYVTEAEKIQPGFEAPGGAVFTEPTAANPSWWHFVEGANWRHPEGPYSSIINRKSDPVVQVTLTDAKAYAEWIGRRLPTEAEWEYAAKAGSQTLYVWGNERSLEGKEMANTWQGAFPIKNTGDDGYNLRAPVGCYEPNGFGLYDMIGNVWEWTDTVWDYPASSTANIIKGGSFLCAENYCRRYRASARQPQEVDFSTNHIGFRTVKSVEE